MLSRRSYVVQVVQLVQVVLLAINVVSVAVDEHTLLDGPGELVLNDAPLPCESWEWDGCVRNASDGRVTGKQAGRATL